MLCHCQRPQEWGLLSCKYDGLVKQNDTPAWLRVDYLMIFKPFVSVFLNLWISFDYLSIHISNDSATSCITDVCIEITHLSSYQQKLKLAYGIKWLIIN